MTNCYVRGIDLSGSLQVLAGLEACSRVADLLEPIGYTLPMGTEILPKSSTQTRPPTFSRTTPTPHSGKSLKPPDLRQRTTRSDFPRSTGTMKPDWGAGDVATTTEPLGGGSAGILGRNDKDATSTHSSRINRLFLLIYLVCIRQSDAWGRISPEDSVMKILGIE